MSKAERNKARLVKGTSDLRRLSRLTIFAAPRSKQQNKQLMTMGLLVIILLCVYLSWSSIKKNTKQKRKKKNDN